ncbi:DUF3164 family protein [Thalassobius sp. S69A]|uniref:DUF3164 family protein n=1 Tax=unclassified Thalassovita TaxID=2619711 RepID=UPI003C7B1476
MNEQADNLPNPGVIDVDGVPHMRDAKGALMPVELIKPKDRLMDEEVRKVVGFAQELSERISRFKGHVFDDLGSLDALLAQEYGAKIGGAKGNRTYMSYDGLMRVQIRVADQIEFGPELQQAKVLVDECLNEWSADSRPEIRALITKAFDTDKEGQINRSEIFTLLQLDIDDERWKEAMRAIKEAIRVVGSKTYQRFQIRDHADAGWDTITIDLAKA